MTIRSLAAVLALCAASIAQNPLRIEAAGRLRAVPGTQCNQAATHTFVCGNVFLASSTLNLAQYANQYVRVRGTPRLVPGCLAEVNLEVDEVVPANARLSTFSLGGYRIGTSFSLLTQVPIGSLAVQLFSFEPAVVPVGGFGTLWMSPLSAQQYAIDVGVGLPLPRFIAIPNEPLLIGCPANFQAAFVDPTTFSVWLGNDACFEVAG